jgi:hypothetical protein
LEGGPANYWSLPVPCHVILYLFFKVIESSVSSRPEVVLGRTIYTKLKQIQDSEVPITRGLGMKSSAEAEASDDDEVLSSFPYVICVLISSQQPAQISGKSRLDMLALLRALPFSDDLGTLPGVPPLLGLRAAWPVDGTGRKTAVIFNQRGSPVRRGFSQEGPTDASRLLHPLRPSDGEISE